MSYADFDDRVAPGPFEIEIWSNRDGRGSEPYIITDKHGRLRMSAGLVKRLKTENYPYKAYLAYEHAHKRILIGQVGVVKPTDANPVTFDAKRHYAYARGFFDKYAIPKEAARYYYDGKYNGWLTFRREGWPSEDGRGS